MRELAVCVQCDNQGVAPKETVEAIYQAGFQNVFVQYYHRENIDYDELEVIDYCKELGLNIVFCHLGYKHINEIWEDSEFGEQVTKRYIEDLDVMKQKGIPMVVMHLTTHKEAPPYNEIGLERIKRIVKRAQELEIKIAFENTRLKGYLEYVLGAIPEDTIGICMDAGHIHVHFQDEFNYSFFQDRYYAVHLHDNHANGDEHLLPFDGTVDWKTTMKKLKENHFAGPLTLELCYRDQYREYSIKEFYEEGYRRGQRLAKMLENA